MPSTDSDGVRIDYAVDGPPDAPALLLLEGLGYGRWMWDWLTDDLTPGFRVIRPDNRGTGDSETPGGPYTIGEMAADAAAVLDDSGLDGGDRVHVVGASMGGMIAQRLARDDDRVATLTLLCTTPGGGDAVPTPEDVLDHIFSVPEGDDERETIRHRMKPAVSDDFYDREPDLVADIVDARLAGDAGPEGREAQAAAVGAFDASEWVGELRQPALVMHGTADRVLPFENGELLAEVLPNATFEAVEGGSHLFFIEERERVNDRVREFLEGHV
ncbi:alpha/beta fold hydrolase [Haloparvum sedimenti]|uniref:alpha/beta fold hydrolase n=1 Tax=Haloparvum sedimenti TaxID=1678448 RepID=UPI00071E902F|nr:alpha/beta hydrolase [Haloparvum sedimenti]